MPSWCSRCWREYGCGSLSEPCPRCDERVLPPAASLTYPEPGQYVATGNGAEVVRR